jgi:hypothetical protein
MGAAREKLRVAHALEELPKISEGFANGTLSYSKVRAITRIADESNEDYLVIKARLPAEQGALIVKALEMAMDADFEETDVHPKGTSPAGTSRRIAGIITISFTRAGLSVRSLRVVKSALRTNENIDSETSRQAGPRCIARWHAGERMDWHAAVGSLFS